MVFGFSRMQPTRTELPLMGKWPGLLAEQHLFRFFPPKSSPLPKGCLSNYYKYIALLEKGVDRSLLKKQLRERCQVGLSGEVYDIPCHQQPIFRPYSAGEFPNAEDICRRHICLPIYSNMTDDEAEYVLFALKSALVEIPTQRNRTASVA